MKSELNGIGPWRLIEVVGTGERATVYKALREGGPPGSPFVAVKVLHAMLASDPAQNDAFVARATIGSRLARLDHPAIVPVLDVVPGPRPYVVQELQDAVALERMMPERGKAKMALEAGTNLMIAVLDALAAAANDKLVHGRLTASDVLIRADGTVRITSFGQDGDPKADFLAVHRLAQSLGSQWLPEVDAWLDRLADETNPWRDLRGARGAFPLAFTEYGGTLLERLVKSRRKKDQKAAEAALAEAKPGASPQASTPKKPRTPIKRRPSAAEAEAALRQARLVAIAAVGLVLVALVLELIGFKA